MSKSLEARIARLEKMQFGGRKEPLFIVYGFKPASEITGYSWDGGKILKKPGECVEALLGRAEKEAIPFIQPWGGLVLIEESNA